MSVCVCVCAWCVCVYVFVCVCMVCVCVFVCVCRFYEKDIAMLHKLLAVPEKDIEVMQICHSRIPVSML